MPRKIVESAERLMAAAVLSVVLVGLSGCGGGESRVKKPEVYAPPPNPDDRVRFDDDNGSGTTSKTRTFPSRR